jgi:hypothetical protein
MKPLAALANSVFGRMAFVEDTGDDQGKRPDVVCHSGIVALMRAKEFQDKHSKIEPLGLAPASSCCACPL